MKVKEENEKADLKLNIQKAKIMAFSPITLGANRWGNNGTSDRLYFLGLQQPLKIVTAAMKLKDPKPRAPSQWHAFSTPGGIHGVMGSDGREDPAWPLQIGRAHV